MVVIEASKLHLPQTDPSLIISSLLFEPISHSLALMLSNSSLLLYPALPLPLSSSSPPSPTLIPPLSTAFSFLRLHPTPNLIFLAARPHAAGSSTLLRAWILTSTFSPIPLNFNPNQSYSSPAAAAVLDLSHGFSVKIAGSVNYFAVHSPSAREIWVISAKLTSEERGDRRCLDLVKCAVIECGTPVYSFRVFVGVLILGEENGVRVFPLRALVKGRVKKQRNLKGDGFVKKEMSCLENGVISGRNGICESSVICSKNMGNLCNGGSSSGLERGVVISSNICKGKLEVDRIRAKRRTIKLRQDSGELGSIFVAFKRSEVQSPNCLQAVMGTQKAVSIHALSQQRFLILDSIGDLHLLSLHNTAIGSEASARSCIPSRDGYMRRLNYTMKVQMLAVLPDISARTHTVWISDGCQSVHIMSLAHTDIPIGESNSDENEERLTQNSAFQAIFTSEKIQDIIPYAANGVLILGQGSIFAYAIA